MLGRRFEYSNTVFYCRKQSAYFRLCIVAEDYTYDSSGEGLAYSNLLQSI